MSQFSNPPISSINAIKSTIMTDALVFRWFLYLITLEKAKSDLVADGENATYAQLKKASPLQTLCSIILFGTVLYVFLTKQE